MYRRYLYRANRKHCSNSVQIPCRCRSNRKHGLFPEHGLLTVQSSFCRQPLAAGLAGPDTRGCGGSCFGHGCCLLHLGHSRHFTYTNIWMFACNTKTDLNRSLVKVEWTAQDSTGWRGERTAGITGSGVVTSHLGSTSRSLLNRFTSNTCIPIWIEHLTNFLPPTRE